MQTILTHSLPISCFHMGLSVPESNAFINRPICLSTNTFSNWERMSSVLLIQGLLLHETCMEHNPNFVPMVNSFSWYVHVPRARQGRLFTEARFKNQWVKFWWKLKGKPPRVVESRSTTFIDALWAQCVQMRPKHAEESCWLNLTLVWHNLTYVILMYIGKVPKHPHGIVFRADWS